MDVALTTADNPYDPLDQFVEWWNNQIELLKAIDEIIELNPLIPYVKIIRESEAIYV